MTNKETKLYSICLTQRCEKFSQKAKIHHAIVTASSVTCNKFHTEDKQILGATITNLVATAIRCPGFVDPWSFVFRSVVVISSYYVIHSFILSVLCLPTGPHLLPQRVLHTLRSSTSYYSSQYPLFSFMSSSSCSRILPRLPLPSTLPSIIPSIT